MKTKRALKEQYKEMKFKMGVYQLRNTANGKIFVDSGTNVDARWNKHRFQLCNGVHPNTELQADWNEYGEAAFVNEFLEALKYSDKPDTNYQKEVATLEEMCLEELQPYGDSGYNRRKRK